MKIKERIQALLLEMNKGIYEKETEIALSLLAAVAGESIIILGPPGVAKSMVARRLKCAFKDARNFEYLMSRFSTPDEIFGPVSISLLKSSDKYERTIEGYLPSADVVFLDEIWKAGPAIQNTLLTVINEKLFRNGDKEIHLPLKLLVAASNELPAQGEGLEALWDRFLIRLESGSVKGQENFERMLMDSNDGKDLVNENKWQITNEEYGQWTERIQGVDVSDALLKCIHVIRKALGAVTVTTSDERRSIYVSDRRWKKIVKLLRTSAFLQDRKKADLVDLLPIYHCLWNEPDECQDIRRIVIRSLFSESGTDLAKMKLAIEADIKLIRMHGATWKAKASLLKRDGNKKIFDSFYYHLLDHDTGNTYIFIADYQRMRDYKNAQKGQLGVLYKDPKNPVRSIIRGYDGADYPDGARQVILVRDNDNVYVDGVQFKIETLAPGEKQKIPVAKGAVSERDYYAELDTLGDKIRKHEADIKGNIFLSDDDRKELDEYLKGLYSEIALTRHEVEKVE
ncbi:MAG: AAA family ATPase [Prevotella sp.]|nr:AAA family ATPase [Prevotella sp.]